MCFSSFHRDNISVFVRFNTACGRKITNKRRLRITAAPNRKNSGFIPGLLGKIGTTLSSTSFKQLRFYRSKKSETIKLFYFCFTNLRNGILKYRKIPKIIPGAYIFQRPFLRGSVLEGLYLGFKIDWASLIVGRKFTVFALFYFVFEGNF